MHLIGLCSHMRQRHFWIKSGYRWPRQCWGRLLVEKKKKKKLNMVCHMAAEFPGPLELMMLKGSENKNFT